MKDIIQSLNYVIGMLGSQIYAILDAVAVGLFLVVIGLMTMLSCMV